MRLQIKSQTRTEARRHQLEIPTGAIAAHAMQGRIQFVLDGETREADWAKISPGVYSLLLGGRSFEVGVSQPKSGRQISAFDVMICGQSFHIVVDDPRSPRASGVALTQEGPQEILAPMPGRIVKVLVEQEQQVKRGEGLLVIEAMKMQNELRAPRPGRVEKIYVVEGAGVESGSKLLRLA